MAVTVQPAYKASNKVKGYHGTASANVDSITKNNFNQSVNDDWCGDAVYFFIEGISTDPPNICAENYVVDSAWHKVLRTHKFNDYDVLEADIKVNNDLFLDMTVPNGMRLFNEYRVNSGFKPAILPSINFTKFDQWGLFKDGKKIAGPSGQAAIHQPQ